MKKCWICGNVANSEEHRFKASDIKRTYGKKFEGAYFDENNKMIDITNYKNKSLKFPKVICEECNTKKTKPHDNSYDLFIEYTDNNFKELLKTKQIDFRKVYGINWKVQKKSLYRYYAKHAGCKIETSDLEYNISTDELANFINGAENIDSFTIQFELKIFVKSLHEYANKLNKYTHLFNGPTIYFGEDKSNLSFGGWLSKNWMTTNWICSFKINDCKKMNFERPIEKLLIKNMDEYQESFLNCTNFNESITYIEYGKLKSIYDRVDHFKKMISEDNSN